MTEKSYRDALTVAMSNAGADSSQLSSWAESLREADEALDVHIATAFRAGNHETAQEHADRGAELQRCADFLQRLYEALENPE